MSNNQVVSKCPKCGSSATFTASSPFFLDHVVEADREFKRTHQSCSSIKTKPENVVRSSDEQIEALVNKYLDRVPRKSFIRWIKSFW